MFADDDGPGLPREDSYDEDDGGDGIDSEEDEIEQQYTVPVEYEALY